MNSKFRKITLCLDMFGCPNRCKHCWVGHSPNGHMSIEDFKQAALQFRQFADKIEMFDWYREPDYKDNYKQMWNLHKQLSNDITPHFELISVWRIVRDKEYARWLASLGLKKAQLTLFGGETTTDFYTGRKGAYKEILQAIDILIENEISPRIQVFVNKHNIEELSLIEKLILENNLERRCENFGGEFACFVHQGSCDGENAKLYQLRVTQEDISKIPQLLANLTLKHFNAANLIEVFGHTERDLYKKLVNEASTQSYVVDTPVFYVDGNFNVYPNVSTPAPYWCLGNLKAHSAEEILQNYLQSNSIAQSMRLKVPICQIVKSSGNPNSLRLFDEQDYVIYLLNKYCEQQH